MCYCMGGGGLNWSQTVSLELWLLTGPLSIPQIMHETWSIGEMILTGKI
jgi:uncharacterized protein (DUF2062 family)